MKQKRLTQKLSVNYSYGAYNKFDNLEQWIRFTEGCPHNCPFCYEPEEFKIFKFPEIVRNHVKIMDMNLLAKPEALGIIKELGDIKVNNRVVYYELVCGIDYRFLTPEIAQALNDSRFKNIRLAWDWSYTFNKQVKEAIKLLTKAGYRSDDIMIFMICNWKISYQDNCKKLDLCKVWNVKVADCYYDNQTMPNVMPLNWSGQEIKSFRSKVRKHNQIVNFKIDPET